MKRLSLAALFFSALSNIGVATHDRSFAQFRGLNRANRHNAPEQKQGKRECARRIRQMASGTHGY